MLRHVQQSVRGARFASADSPVARSAMMAIIAASLLPILLGAIAGSENMRREAFRKMREDHLRRIALGRERLAQRHNSRHFQSMLTDPAKPNSSRRR